jgi:hypothetical protein
MSFLICLWAIFAVATGSLRVGRNVNNPTDSNHYSAAAHESYPESGTYKSG